MKKRNISTPITIFVLAGLLIAPQAEAGFFDWLKITPLRQEAAAIRVIKWSEDKSQIEKQGVAEPAEKTSVKSEASRNIFEKLLGSNSEVESVNGVPEQDEARQTSGELYWRWPEIRVPFGPVVDPVTGEELDPDDFPDPPSIPSPLCGHGATFENMYIPFHGQVYRDRQQDFMNIKVNAPSNCPIAITGMDIELYVNYDEMGVYQYGPGVDLRLNTDYFLHGVQFTNENAILTPTNALMQNYGQEINSMDGYMNYHPDIPGGSSRVLTIGAKDPTLWFYDSENETYGYDPNTFNPFPTYYDDPRWEELVNPGASDPQPVFRLRVKRIRYENTNTMLGGQHPQFEKEVDLQSPLLDLHNQTAHTYIHKDTWPFMPRWFNEELNSDQPPYGAFNEGNHFYWNSGERPAGNWTNATTNMLANTQIQFCYPSDYNPWEPACSLIVSPVGHFTRVHEPQASDGDLHDEGNELYKTQMNISNLHPDEARTRTGKILIKKAFSNGTRHYYSPYNVTIRSSEI
jgi:hypothetical protein